MNKEGRRENEEGRDRRRQPKPPICIALRPPLPSLIGPNPKGLCQREEKRDEGLFFFFFIGDEGLFARKREEGGGCRSVRERDMENVLRLLS